MGIDGRTDLTRIILEAWDRILAFQDCALEITLSRTSLNICFLFMQTKHLMKSSNILYCFWLKAFQVAEFNCVTQLVQ